MAVASVLAQAKGLGRDVRTVERAVRHGVKGMNLQPGPGQILDIAVNWHQRTVRIRGDDRRDKKWRHARDKVLRPLLPPPIRMFGRLFRRRRRG